MTQIAIVAISDRASRGEYKDLGGPAIERWLRGILAEPREPALAVEHGVEA